MRFTDFKSAEIDASSAVIAASASGPATQYAGRTIIRDWSADPWDTDALDAKICPSCGADVAHRPGVKSDNVAYYDCKERVEHRFARIFKQPSTATSTLALASEHQTTLLTAARTVAERSKNG